MYCPTRFAHFFRMLIAFAVLAWSATTVDAQQDVQEVMPPSELKVFHLQEVQANEASAIVQNIFDDGGIRVALDQRTNSLIVSGSADRLREIEALLQNIDQPAKNPAPADGKLPPVQVRVFWLTTGTDGQSVPDSLYPVVEEMQELGIIDLKLGGQTAVNVGLAGKPFTVMSSPRLGQEKMNLQFQGQLGSGPNNLPVLQVELDLTAGAPRQSLARIQTSIEAPLNQYVVLGMTNASGLDSVFVIQLVPQQKPAPLKK
jgi:hypothetical protein